jgi:hypothetical protein
VPDYRIKIGLKGTVKGKVFSLYPLADGYNSFLKYILRIFFRPLVPDNEIPYHWKILLVNISQHIFIIAAHALDDSILSVMYHSDMFIRFFEKNTRSISTFFQLFLNKFIKRLLSII